MVKGIGREVESLSLGMEAWFGAEDDEGSEGVEIRGI
jgi:hypothetical protein